MHTDEEKNIGTPKFPIAILPNIAIVDLIAILSYLIILLLSVCLFIKNRGVKTIDNKRKIITPREQ